MPILWQVIDSELYRNLGISMACVFATTLILLADIIGSIQVMLCVLMTLVSWRYFVIAGLIPPLLYYPLSPARSVLPLISAQTGFLDWGLVTRWAQLLITSNNITYLAPERLKCNICYLTSIPNKQSPLHGLKNVPLDWEAYSRPLCNNHCSRTTNLNIGVIYSLTVYSQKRNWID